MALSGDAQKKIMDLIKAFKALMKLKSSGPQRLTQSEWKALINSEFWKKGNPEITAPVGEAYLLTHQQVVGENGPAPKAMRDGAMQFLERTMERYSGKAVDQLSTDILSTVETQLFPFEDRREGEAIYEALKDPNIYKKNLRSLLEDKVDNWTARYKTVVKTELNRASNWGSMDAILHNNPDKEPHQLTVYKQGNKPGHGACKYCEKFWYMDDRITPRTYRLSELIANGSNLGKKAADWQPTVDSTHPNESHLLNELRPGFGFDNGGNITYVREDHDEYKKQKGDNE